jgi:murein L,D-transpeptidase YafK
MAQNDNRTNLGGDIFIHGKNKTIGCVPVGDRGMEELFILMSHVLPAKIEVIISPWDFRKRQDIPEITSINWEQALYDQIQLALKAF